MPFHRSLFFIALAFLLVTRGTEASVVAESDVAYELSHAALVAQIQIISTTSAPDAVHYATFQSQATILHVEHINDDGGVYPAEGDTISITGPGGEWNDVGVMISGYPRPRTGRRYLAHLKRNLTGTFSIAGWDEGLQDLNPLRNYSRNRTDGSNGDGDGPFLFWDSGYFPIPYYISAPSFVGHADFIQAIDKSFKTWRDVQNIKVEFLPLGCSNGTKNENDGVNTVILKSSKWLFDPSIIAITRNFYIAGSSARAGMILDSDILLNGVDHSFTTTNEIGKHDVQNIVTHETGHFLGLGNEVAPVDPDATMFAVASPNEFNKRVLHADDLPGIHSAYAGVGNKLSDFKLPSCTIPDQKYGCAAAHNSSRGAESLWYAMIYVMALVGLGRWYTSRYFNFFISTLAFFTSAFFGNRSINS